MWNVFSVEFVLISCVELMFCIEAFKLLLLLLSVLSLSFRAFFPFLLFLESF